MNKIDKDILRTLLAETIISQRELSEKLDYSLGAVNKSLNNLKKEGYIDSDYKATRKAIEDSRRHKPERAIILAAGYGLRMVPINHITPKAFLEVRGEALIDRIIRQLHDVGITEIVIIVGFMKERFDCLIDKYGVELVVNQDYYRKNTLSSLSLVANRLSNSYIIPADLWFENNPFNSHEYYSWYMVSDKPSSESDVRINRKQELTRISADASGNTMIGLSYITNPDARALKTKIESLAKDRRNDSLFWETALYENNKMTVLANLINDSGAVEINTYEQLRDLDNNSNHLKADSIKVITEVFNCKPDEIVDISVLKKGMTNRSFLFKVRDERYIMRIPGEGTELLIDRYNETKVYGAIKGKGLCDDPVYINPVNGYKITKYLNDIRVCDTNDPDDIAKCMDLLKSFHSMKLEVDHSFDIFGQIEFYESLRNNRPSMYSDYEQTKRDVMSLKGLIDSFPKQICLTHIDAVPDNFLFYKKGGKEKLQLTDWEYSGMQDPHVDIAMFCIYSMYDKDKIDRLIDIYFENSCTDQVRTKIYAYISACGFLWSNWCEYKSVLGVEFGEYSIRQYRYAKDYYAYVKQRMGW